MIFFTAILHPSLKSQNLEKSRKIIKNHQKSSKKHVISFKLAYGATQNHRNDVIGGDWYEIEHVEGIFEKKSKFQFLEALTFWQKDIKFIGFLL